MVSMVEQIYTQLDRWPQLEPAVIATMMQLAQIIDDDATDARDRIAALRILHGVVTTATPVDRLASDGLDDPWTD